MPPLYISRQGEKARSTRAVVKGEKMKEKIERFLVEPNLTPVFGQTITKDTELDVWTEDKKVHQIIKDLTITTISEDGTETDNYDMKFKRLKRVHDYYGLKHKVMYYHHTKN